MATDREAALREAERLDQGPSDPHRAALRAARVPITITDARSLDNPIVFVNEAFVRISGYPRDEIIGRNCRFLQGPDTDRSEVARIAATLARGGDVSSEILNYRKDGSAFWNALHISPVFDGAGEITHFFGSQIDVTERNRSAQELRDANVALAQARDSAEALVAERTRELEGALAQETRLLHELDHRVKNNLQLISSLIQLQSRRLPDPAAQAAMKSVLGRVGAIAAAHRNLTLIDGETAFDVAAFLRDIAADLLEACGRDDVTLEFDMSGLIVPAVSAAPIALIVHELIENALRHAFPAHGGLIRLSLRESAAGHLVEVRDDGVGRADGQADGFGLGLVDLLTRQLSATLIRSDAGPGHAVALEIPARDRD